MMVAGRKPTPTHLKIVHGNPGKRRLPKDEPAPLTGIPPCPRWLSASGKAAWKRIAPELGRMGVLTLADASALEMLVEAYAEWQQARKVLAKNGLTYTTKTAAGAVTRRARPETVIARDAWRRCMAALTEFGLTPSSRSRVGRAPEGAKADPFDEFLSGADEEAE